MRYAGLTIKLSQELLENCVSGAFWGLLNSIRGLPNKPLDNGIQEDSSGAE